MVNPFICGCGSFHHQAEDDDDDDESCNPCATPRKQKKSSNRIFRSKDNKNPYSTCGLDKFSALLAKLEDKRQEIYTQMGSEVCYVRFVYTNSKKFKPVVVKVRDKEQKKYIFDDDKCKSMADNSVASDRFPIESGDETTKKKMEMWRPYYLAEVIIFILLVLAVFRLTIAILCTSLGWYLVSGISNAFPNAERRRKQQDMICKKGE